MALHKFVALCLAIGSLSGSVLAQPAVSVVSSDISKVRVFPNPWRGDMNAGQNIVIDHIPADSEVKIFTVSGHWVRTLSSGNSSEGASWDLMNTQGEKVASGIYLYLVSATAPGGTTEKAQGKIVVIK